MRLRRKAAFDLEFEAYADPEHSRPKSRKNRIVVGLPSSQAHAVWTESQAGAQTEVEGFCFHPLVFRGIRFEDLEGALHQLMESRDSVEVEALTDDEREGQGAIGTLLEESGQIEFGAQRGVDSNHAWARGFQFANPVEQEGTGFLAPSSAIRFLCVPETAPEGGSGALLELGRVRNCHLRKDRFGGMIDAIPMLKQATAMLLLSSLCLFGQTEKEAEEAKFEYQQPVVQKLLFGDSVMLAQERHDYATNLATYAANHVIAKTASKSALESARRILALALHLERRNKQAMVVNFQLKQGVLPEIKKGEYNPRTFSRLLLARAKLLLKSDNESEKLLAHCFVELAAVIDPRNEDAVFAYENQRIDAGEIDWRILTDSVADKPSQAPQDE